MLHVIYFSPSLIRFRSQAQDKVFAADYDVKKKQQETEREIKLQYLEQQKLNALQLLNQTKALQNADALLLQVGHCFLVFGY